MVKWLANARDEGGRITLRPLEYQIRSCPPTEVDLK
jgi:hypothetical protein